MRVCGCSSFRQRVLASLLATVGLFPAANACADELRITRDKAFAEVSNGSDARHTVVRYRYNKTAWKPYVDQLATPAGVQILRDSPGDHKHHHGLMFGLTVDGVDFWSEAAKVKKGRVQTLVGTQEPTSIRDLEPTAAGGARCAGFVQELDWLDPGRKPLLWERRTIVALQADDLGATLVEWRCRLQPPQGVDSATLSGSHYVGLGMRFVESMDKDGRFFNADDKPGSVVRGDERLTATKWCAYTARAEGKPVTVAIFDHPANLRHPAAMFTMAKPFAYLSATLNVWKQPVVVKADKPLPLVYAVALWDGHVGRPAVEKLYQRWLRLSSEERATHGPQAAPLHDEDRK
jgi:hypothetical protein